MATEQPQIVVPSPTAANEITISTTKETIKRRPFWILLANGLSLAAGVLLAVLDYLQTVSIAGVFSPERALMWVIGINVLTIVLRQFAKPQVTQTQTMVTSANPSEPR